MDRRLRLVPLAVCILMVLALPGQSVAQTIGATTGTINGAVTDDSEAIIPGVTITISGPAQMGTRLRR